MVWGVSRKSWVRTTRLGLPVTTTASTALASEPPSAAKAVDEDMPTADARHRLAAPQPGPAAAVRASRIALIQPTPTYANATDSH